MSNARKLPSLLARYLSAAYISGLRIAYTPGTKFKATVGSDKNPAAYISFDRPTQMAAASDPDNFLSSHKDALIIDEVQMAPELFRALKVVVDEIRLKDKLVIYCRRQVKNGTARVS